MACAAAGLDGGFSHLCAEAAEGQPGHGASWQSPALLLLLEGPAHCEAEPPGLHLHGTYGFSQSWAACMVMLLWWRHKSVPLSCKLDGLVGFPDEGLGTGTLLSADLGLSQGIHF